VIWERADETVLEAKRPGKDGGRATPVLESSFWDLRPWISIVVVALTMMVKFTGASSSGERVGELYMKGAISIIDFVSMPEAALDLVCQSYVSPTHAKIPRKR
jgi:hypothetical protein